MTADSGKMEGLVFVGRALLLGEIGRATTRVAPTRMGKAVGKSRGSSG